MNLLNRVRLSQNKTTVGLIFLVTTFSLATGLFITITSIRALLVLSIGFILIAAMIVRYNWLVYAYFFALLAPDFRIASSFVPVGELYIGLADILLVILAIRVARDRRPRCRPKALKVIYRLIFLAIILLALSFMLRLVFVPESGFSFVLVLESAKFAVSLGSLIILAEGLLLSEHDAHKAILLVLATTACVVVISILQFYAPDLIQTLYRSPEISGRELELISPSGLSLAIRRLSGPFGGVGTLGIFLILPSLALMFNRGKIATVIRFPLLGAIAFLIVNNDTRSALIGLGVGLVVYWILIGRDKTMYHYAMIALLVLLPLVASDVLRLVFSRMPPLTYDLWEQRYRTFVGGTALSYRLYYSTVGLSALSAQPLSLLIGMGFEPVRELPLGLRIFNLHNSYVSLLFRTGALVTTLLLAVVVYSGLQALRLRRIAAGSDRELCNIYVIWLVALSISSILDDVLFFNYKIMALLWLLTTTVFISQIQRTTKTDQEPLSRGM